MGRRSCRESLLCDYPTSPKPAPGNPTQGNKHPNPLLPSHPLPAFPLSQTQLEDQEQRNLMMQVGSLAEEAEGRRVGLEGQVEDADTQGRVRF